MKRVISRRRYWPIAVLVIVVAGIIWFVTSPGKIDAVSAVARPQPVRVATVAQGDFNIIITGIGTVTPENTVTVRTRVDGQLMRLHFTEGQMVKQGDLLAEIDPRPFEVQLMQAKGQMAKDQALLANARQDLARYNLLRKQESASQQQVDTQQALVRQYEAAIKIDQGQIDAAELQLTYSRIIAPLNGRTGLKQVDPGNMLHSADGAGIVVITRLHPITVLFTITEQQLPEVLAEYRSGKVLTVEAWDREQRNLLATGKLITVDNLIDPATGTLRMKAEFTNENGMLFPNQFVNARLMVRTIKDAVQIPSSALQTGSRGPYVFVVENGKVKMRTVKPGPRDNAMINIPEGLTAGEIVVIDGIDRLREGTSVSYVSTPNSSSQGVPNKDAQGAANKDTPKERK